MNSKIIGYGKFLPEDVVTNDNLAELIDTSDEWIYQRTGIKERRFSKVNTSELCFKCSENILKNAKVKPEEVDLIIVATFTPDYLTPSVACIVQEKLGAVNATCFDINVACSGFVFALSIADKYIKSGAYKKALVIGGEVISKTLNFEDRSTAVIFGDGAGGVLLEATTEEGGIIGESLKSQGDSKSLHGKYLKVKNILIDEQVPESENYIYMDGREVLNFVNSNVVKNIKEVLEKANTKLEDISYIVPHQANDRLLDMIAKKLEFDRDRIFSNIKNVGNTSAGSVPIALADALESGVIKLNSKEKIVLTGFGSGLAYGTILMQL